MVKLALQMRAEMQGVKRLCPSRGMSFMWFIKLKCSQCGQLGNFIGVSEDEKVDVPGGKGTANLAGKCKFCSRQYSVSIIAGSTAPYTKSGEAQTIAAFEMRGAEAVEFEPRDGWVATGEESDTAFEEVDLSELEWYDYDEKKEDAVQVTDFEFEFVKV